MKTSMKLLLLDCITESFDQYRWTLPVSTSITIHTRDLRHLCSHTPKSDSRLCNRIIELGLRRQRPWHGWRLASGQHQRRHRRLRAVYTVILRTDLPVAWTIMHRRTVPSQSNRRVMWTDSAKLVLHATRRSTFGVVLFQRRPHVPGMHYHLTSVPHHRSSLTDECSNWHMFQTSFPNSLALAFKTLSVCWYVYMLFVQCSCKLLPWHNSNKCFNGNNNNNNNNTKKKNKNESRNIRTADLRQCSGSRKILTILIISRGCKNFV